MLMEQISYEKNNDHYISDLLKSYIIILLVIRQAYRSHINGEGVHLLTYTRLTQLLLHCHTCITIKHAY